jgi:two-component system sensor histidine kinase NblS
MNNSLKKTFSEKKILETLTHEIRSPLFNIKSFLETLYEYHFQLTDIQILEFLETATQETNRLVRLTNQSLHRFRLNSSVPIIRRVLSPEGIINRVSKAYEITVMIKRINFYHKVKLNSSTVRGNHDLLFQVLINLITNSVKFTYPKGVLLIKLKNVGSVSVGARKKSYGVRVEVLDTGIGLQKRKKKRYFAPDSKTDTVNPRIDGNGIGLNIVKEILRIHNKSPTLVSTMHRGASVFFNL